MYLQRIEIAGFKSFAKKTTLEFRTSITAIVGPNGSGKSNVAEAFSFVLGEQSMKSMRGKRGDDLIWNGSTNTPQSNRASVKVVFDNRKKFLKIDFDEVVVERVVHRDGANDYLINGSKVRLKDVVELLSGANIGPSGHHIISQGEADRVLNVSPKERRVIVEDALGLKIYQIKKKEAERRLDKTEENLKQVESLRREIKPHLKFLGGQVSKIEKTLELKEDLEILYRKYFALEEGYIEYQKKYLREALLEPERTKKKLEEEYRSAKERLEKSRGVKLDSSKINESKEELRKLEERKEEILKLEGRLEGELASLKSMEKGEASKVILFSKVKEFFSNITSQIEELSEVQSESLLKGKILEIKKKINDFLGESKENPALERLDDVERELKRVGLDKEELVGKERKLREELKTLEEAETSTKGEGLEAEKEIYRLEAELNKLEISLERLIDQKERLEVEEESFKRELEEALALIGPSVNDRDGIIISEARIKDREAQKERLGEVQKMKIRLEEAGGGSGEEIIKEFNEVKERDEFLEKEVEDLRKTKKSLLDLINDLEEQLKADFKKGLEKIDKEFQEFFSLMFGGGKASLKIVRERISTDEEEEVYEEGVDIDVNLPKKKIKGLMMLSGGERALTSIALIFAMSQVNPPPFIILDETDAALDEANSRRYGDMIENLAKHSELILITHNRETMSRAGVLYGVTMASSGVSEVLSVDLERAVEVAK